MNNSIFDDYLAKLDRSQRSELNKIRTIVKEIAPDATEVISYGIPGYKYKGQYLIGFAAFKNHLSIFPTSSPIENLKDKLKGYKIAKGTIQFNSDNPLPEFLIKEIIYDRLSGITNKLG
jgi:uncharacterized protein YdhG (YjbR/CyaY superfamily)